MAKSPHNGSSPVNQLTGRAIGVIREMLLPNIHDKAESRRKFAKRAKMTAPRLIELEEGQAAPTEQEALRILVLSLEEPET